MCHLRFYDINWNKMTVPLVEKELFTLPEHIMISPPVFSRVRISWSVVFYGVFCSSWFVLSSFSFWSLCCWFTDSDYHFGFFKLFMQKKRNKDMICMFTINLALIIFYCAVICTLWRTLYESESCWSCKPVLDVTPQSFFKYYLTVLLKRKCRIPLFIFFIIKIKIFYSMRYGDLFIFKEKQSILSILPPTWPYS